MFKKIIIEKKKKNFYEVCCGDFVEEFPELKNIKLGVIKYHSKRKRYYFKMRDDRTYLPEILIEIGEFMEKLEE